MVSINLKSNRWLFAIILLFIVICALKIILSLPFSSPYIMMDEVYYDSVARNVLYGKLYAQEFISQGLSTTPPGYSVFISVAYLFSQDKSIVYHVMLAINAILTTAVIFPAYFTLRRYCSEAASLLGALVVATLPVFNLFPFLLMSENLFFPLFVFSIWFLIEAYDDRGWFWEFLASLSIVYIYMTRSPGIAMLVGFVITFICYVFVNRKQGILTVVGKKKVLIISFFVLLLLWLAYTSFCMPSGSYSIGSPYRAESAYTSRLVSAATNLDVFISYVKTFVSHMDYLFLSTYFVLLFVIFYYSRSLYLRSLDIPLLMAFVYFLVSSIGMLAISMTSMYYVYMRPLESYATDQYKIYGRYVEGVVPVTFVFGIIGMYRLLRESKHISSLRKWVLPFLSLLAVLLFILATIPLKNYNIVNTLSLYYLYVIYYKPFIYALLVVFSLSIFLVFYLSFTDRRYFYYLLGVFVCFSIIFSAPTYNLQKMCSHEAVNDNISQYLIAHPSKDMAVLMDKVGASWYLRGEAMFWCNGDVPITPDIVNESSSENYKNHVLYVISSKEYPYKLLANGSMGSKLYIYG